ncbi:MAG TPA: carbonic anhydrase [bacterium]
MRIINPRWILLALFVFAAPLAARERTGELAPPKVKKEQDAIMKALMDGNKKHASHRTLKSGLPKIMVVSCADSRVPPEAVFNLKPGELYTNRAFGSIVDKVILGSLEYGAEILHCRVLVVLGHTNCTAVKEAIAEHNHPRTEWRSLNQRSLYEQIEPSVAEVEESNLNLKAKTDKQLEGEALLEGTVKSNILHTMHSIREQSPMLWKLEQDDLLRIVGGVYNLDTGKVEWIKE